MLLIIYMAFTFGILLPILFPICAFALFSIYVLDVIMLTYWYRKPPNFSEELYLKALKILKYAPIPMFAFGYWGLSNVQMFNNIPMKINFPNFSLEIFWKKNMGLNVSTIRSHEAFDHGQVDY